MNQSPAHGERRAVVGYHGQYDVSAALILTHLIELEAIRIADPTAGRVDDFQIKLPNRIEGFQVKWSEYPGAFTFRELTRASDDKPSIIQQLADGWQRIRTANPLRHTEVRFVTNSIPSTNDDPPVGDTAPEPNHFAAFMKQAWEPFSEKQSEVPIVWRPAWATLIKASGLSESLFEDFAKSCTLEFDYRLPLLDPSPDGQPASDSELRHVAATLFSLVADPARVVELSRKDLLRELGWEDRFEYRSRHEFPDPSIPYSPIEQSVRSLTTALNTLAGGYLGLFGAPGSGKSTLLTKTLRALPIRLLRYYAYIPDDVGPRGVRGESANFFHDINLQIENAGFHAKHLAHPDPAQLLKRFHEQLQVLHQDWKTQGTKTVLLVDGLDHIVREQNPQRSLLDDLPTPDQLPDGVFFILGSQTEDPLPPRIRSNISNEGRRISIAPLTRAAVCSILADAGLPINLPQERQDLVYEKCTGNPLALAYIVNRLRALKPDEDSENILKGIDRYDSTIEEQYETYWAQIADNRELKTLFGLLSRIRGVVDLRWVRMWSGPTALEALISTASHYFRREGERWYFFHNSFRVFLQRRTQEQPLGNSSGDLDRELYRALAGHCSAPPSSNSPYSWDELYYRYQAQDYADIVKRASPKYFREQLLALRPGDAIRDDIDLALLASRAVRDPEVLVRLLLSAAEFRQRAYYLDEIDLFSLMMSLNRVESALGQIREGKSLRISATAALKTVHDLIQRGMQDEARQIFELAEPIQLLSGAEAIKEPNPHDQFAILKAWADVAPFFLSWPEIFESLERVRAEAMPMWQMSTEEATQHAFKVLRSHVGYGALYKGDFDGLDSVFAQFDLGSEDDLAAWCWLSIRVCDFLAENGDNSEAQRFLKSILTKVNPIDCGPEERLLVAEWVFRLTKDAEQARRWLDGVPQPALQKETSSQDGFEPFKVRLRLNRLLFALGSNETVTSLVPEEGDSRHEPMVFFERAVCKVAWVYGRAWSSEKMTDLEISTLARELLRFLNRDPRNDSDRIYWWTVRDLRKHLFVELVRSISLHGSSALESLRATIQSEWNDPNSVEYWSPALMRDVILELFAQGVEKEWAEGWLRTIESKMVSGTDISSRVAEYYAQAEAWHALGNTEDVKNCVTKMLQSSFGVGHRKDHQLESWISWLARIVDDEPALAGPRIAWFASSILAFEEYAESPGVLTASRDLLGIAARWSPRRSVGLFRWLAQHGLITYTDGLYQLLWVWLDKEPAAIQGVLAVYSYFYLAIAHGGTGKLAAHIVRQGFTQLGKPGALDCAQTIWRALDRFGLPSSREAMRKELAVALDSQGVNPKDCGLSLDESSDEDGGQKERSELQLGKDVLGVEEVIKRIRVSEDLFELLNRSESHSSFDWSHAIRVVGTNFSAADLIRLSEWFFGRRRSSDALCAIAEHLRIQGSTAAAWKVGLQAVESSDRWGWSPHYDGGSRIKAFETLMKIDSNNSCELAYDVLVQDLAAEYKYPDTVVLHLDRILPLITSEIPLNGIWKHIEAHVQALFADIQTDSDIAALVELVPETDTVESALEDLLIVHLDHPSLPVVQAAQRALGACLRDGIRTGDKVVEMCLGGSEAQQYSVLMVLDAISLARSLVLNRFADSIQELTLSSNFSIRYCALTLCDRLGISVARPTSQESRRSLVYDLVLPPSERVRDEPPVPGEPLSDSDIPAEMLRPFDHNLNVLAESLGIEPTNLLYRAAQIMQEMEPRKTWSADAELELRKSLDSTGLKFTFRRPRTILARRAMYHVVSELVDAGQLTYGQVELLDFVLRSYDPSTVLLEPSTRPDHVGPIKHWDEYRVGCEQWVDTVADAFDCCADDADDRYVLAEETVLKCLEIARPSEMRQTLVSLSGDKSNTVATKQLSFFKNVKQHWMSEYATLGVSGSPLPIVMQHFGIAYDSPASDWLALNPLMGKRMGWRISNEGLFRWLDDEGATMVESVWWVDGQPYQNEITASQDEIGEGWIVLASESAVKQLRNLGTLLRRQRVERRYPVSRGSTIARHLLREFELV